MGLIKLWTQHGMNMLQWSFRSFHIEWDLLTKWLIPNHQQTASLPRELSNITRLELSFQVYLANVINRISWLVGSSTRLTNYLLHNLMESLESFSHRRSWKWIIRHLRLQPEPSSKQATLTSQLYRPRPEPTNHLALAMYPKITLSTVSPPRAGKGSFLKHGKHCSFAKLNQQSPEIPAQNFTLTTRRISGDSNWSAFRRRLLNCTDFFSTGKLHRFGRHLKKSHQVRLFSYISHCRIDNARKQLERSWCPCWA